MKLVSIRPTDLTEGTPIRVLLLYAVPMLVSMFFQQAYNLVDSYIAGNFIGKEALGAVGTSYPVTVLFVAIATGLSLGTSLFCSDRFGAGENDKVRQCISTSLVSFIPASFVISAVGLVICPYILRWLAVPAEAIAATSEYMRVYIMSLPCVFLYNICNGVLNGLGDSRTPLIFLIISSVCNIFLDMVFVVLIPLGVTGLALATLLAQGFSGILTLLAVSRMYKRLGKRLRLFNGEILQRVLSLGIPSMVQHIFMSMGQLTIQNVINGYGLITMAGYSVSFRINGIYVNAVMALSNALSGFIAQNKGAGKGGRIKEGIRISVFVALLFSAIVVLVLQLFGPAILGFFVQDGADKESIVSAGMGFVRVVVPFYMMVCIKMVYDGALRGVGAMKLYMLVALTDVAVRIVCGRLFSHYFGIWGVWSVWPVAWFLGTSMSISFYLWKGKQNEVSDLS